MSASSEDPAFVMAESVAESAGTATGSARVARLLAWEQLLLSLSDRFNPILVKEARQALKSRQFAITFALLLACAVGWALIGILVQVPRIYYQPGGKDLLFGFYLIVAVPLLVIVPFSAFRSLASEREDGTWELISITALSARQIITGKLVSAMMQMAVYYAAIAPCITLTYLLRGVDIVSIVLMLVYTLLLSILLSAGGLVCAGQSQSRSWQALTSVSLILLLLLVLWGWSALIYIALYEDPLPFDSLAVWVTQLFVLNMYGTYLVLLILCAAAQNTFASENRSSKLRITLLVQLVCFGGWLALAYCFERSPEVIAAMLFVAVAHWLIYGALMIGEVAELSPRAKRNLPQSYLGRALFTWFNPGSATGYVFAVLTFSTFVAGMVLFVSMHEIMTGSWINQRGVGFRIDLWAVTKFGGLLCGYFSLYLGLSRLIVAGLRKVGDFGLAVAVLVTGFVVVASAAGPYFVGLWWNRFRNITYTEWQFLNWAWTLAECIRSRSVGGVTGTAALIVGSLGAAMFALGVLLAHHEVEKVRLVVPERVRQDDAARKASRK